MSRDETRVRVGVAIAVFGVVLAALPALESPLRVGGGVVVLIGWALAAYGLHRYGRTG